MRPRKIGPVVLGSNDDDGSQRFFHKGIGFKAGDTVPTLFSAVKHYLHAFADDMSP